MKYVGRLLDLNLWFLGAFEKLRKVTIRFIMCCYPSVRPSAWDNSAPTERIFMKFYVREFFEKLSRKFEFHSYLTRTTGTLHEDQNIYFIISRSFLLRMRNISDISSTETQNIHFAFNKFFFSKIVPFTR